MNNTYKLTKVLFKNSSSTTKKQRILYLIAAITLIPSFALVFGMFSYLYQTLAPLALESAVLVLGLFAGNFMILIFGLFFIPSLFFFSSDNETLLYLPFTPLEIAIAKLALTIPSSYLTYGIIAIPSVSLYLYYVHTSPLHIFLLLLITVVLPLVTLLLTTLLATVFTRFVPFFRNKDLMTNVMMFVLLALVIGFNFFISSQFSLDPTQLQELLLQNIPKISESFTIALPYVPWLVNGLLYGQLLMIGSALLFIIGVVLLFIAFVRTQLLEIMTTIKGSPSKTKKLNTIEVNKASTQRNVFFTFVLKEIRTLVRTPIFFQNCVLTNYLLPILVLLPFLFDQSSTEMIQTLLPEILSSFELLHFVLIGFGTGFLLANMNLISATALSRTGTQFYFLKLFPTSIATQINAMIWTGIIFGFSAFIIIIPLVLWIAKLSFLQTFFFVLFGLFGVIFGNYLGFIMDLLHPNLTWTSEVVAVKQNINGLLMLFVSMGGGAGIIALTIINPFSSLIIIAILVFSIVGGLALFIYLYYYKNIVTFIERIES